MKNIVSLTIFFAISLLLTSAFAYEQKDLEQLLKTNSCSDCDLSGAVLTNADLAKANLKGADLSGANLRGALMRMADMTESSLVNADLREAIFEAADLYRADLSGALLENTNFEGAYLVEAVLPGTEKIVTKKNHNLQKEQEVAPEVAPVQQREVPSPPVLDSSSSNMDSVISSEKKLENERPKISSNMIETAASQEIPVIVPEAIVVTKADLLEKLFDTDMCLECDLGGVNLSGANLKETYLERANLTGADLSRANLKDANLKGANLQNANLRGANLKGADLYMANLAGADLTGANLTDTSIDGAYLTGALLDGADAEKVQE